MLRELSDSLDNNNEEVTEHIETLSNQYEKFEKLVEKMIQQMNLMSESDYEVLKGFLNE